MAASKSTESKTQANPSGASDEQLREGEMTGKVRGADVDKSYHVYEFTDPKTGEPVEWETVVHDVMVDSSGTVEPGDASFVHASEGEAGEAKPAEEKSK